MSTPKKIVLTGASGFIGHAFMQESAVENITPFSFQTGDIDTLDLSTCDAIVHLAALVHQMNGADAETYEAINVTRTLELARKAKRDGIRHFLFMSTVKVYGEESDETYTEDTPCHPEDEYGKSKLKAEQELQKLEDDTFAVSIIRTPIVYGTGVKANIKNLIELIKEVPILPFADTHNIRSMVYVGNLCHLIDVILKQKKGGIFLACDDVSLSTTRFIRLIAATLNKRIYLLYLPFFETFLKLLKPSFHKRLFESLKVDNTKTKNELNFHNPYSVEEGVRIMLEGEKR